MPDPITIPLNQRERDLLRYCRIHLHSDDLISDDEYAEMAQWGSGAARRLENYDELRARIASLTSALPSQPKASEPPANAETVASLLRDNQELREKLKEIIRIKNDQLGTLPVNATREEIESRETFHRGARMAYWRCAEIASSALSASGEIECENANGLASGLNTDGEGANHTTRTGDTL